ncbi:peptide chain release factor 1 [Parcubacteria bacterium DG_74_2]|nr:MAG: peptide chain release factor 1 [Parcubacteria bacterium DG_74_2]
MEKEKIKKEDREVSKKLSSTELVSNFEEIESKIGSIIVEIRAGVGGEEAALFSKDLFKMYSKYAVLKNWKQKILDSNPSELGGFKQIVLELKNGDVFPKMKYEAGVHRVQRIPVTEKSGRIHTSTVTVAVLPRPKKAIIKINPNDLKMDFYKASGPGGQYVNKRMTAVRITHLPTGIVVTSQAERNQHQNKENAISILEAKILERERLKKEQEVSTKRKSQIGWAKRAEKIRTYNLPQNRITDHRIKKSWHEIDKIMDGRLDPIIKSLEKKLTSF